MWEIRQLMEATNKQTRWPRPNRMHHYQAGKNVATRSKLRLITEILQMTTELWKLKLLTIRIRWNKKETAKTPKTITRISWTPLSWQPPSLWTQVESCWTAASKTKTNKKRPISLAPSSSISLRVVFLPQTRQITRGWCKKAKILSSWHR